jgi:hypothetical protein
MSDGGRETERDREDLTLSFQGELSVGDVSSGGEALVEVDSIFQVASKNDTAPQTTLLTTLLPVRGGIFWAPYSGELSGESDLLATGCS